MELIHFDHVHMQWCQSRIAKISVLYNSAISRVLKPGPDITAGLVQSSDQLCIQTGDDDDIKLVSNRSNQYNRQPGLLLKLKKHMKQKEKQPKT